MKVESSANIDEQCRSRAASAPVAQGRALGVLNDGEEKAEACAIAFAPPALGGEGVAQVRIGPLRTFPNPMHLPPSIFRPSISLPFALFEVWLSRTGFFGLSFWATKVAGQRLFIAPARRRQDDRKGE